MICPACGAANEDGVPFCESCKADLEMPPIAPPESDLKESVYSPPEEEPIPLEPIALEPVEEAEAKPESSGPEPVAATLDSTGDHPALEPVATGPSDDFPTRDIPEPPTTPATIPRLPSTNPKLIVVRGQKIDAEYPIYPGKNYMGRTDDKPVDIDLEDQESAERIWSSRQHAVINFENDKLTLEDLNSLNGTFVNRNRVHPGQLKELQADDVIQIGTVHMKVVYGSSEKSPE